MTIFVYCPRSGSRIFASNPHDGVVLVEWSNGCSHVVGGVHLIWGTAAPGEHWRNDARAIATHVVCSFGGVAWDEQGSVHLVVPERTSGVANQLMRATRIRTTQKSRYDRDDCQNQIACLLDETARLNPESLRVEMISAPRRPRRTATAIVSPPEEGKQQISIRIEEQEFHVRAPESWGEPRLRGILVKDPFSEDLGVDDCCKKIYLNRVKSHPI